MNEPSPERSPAERITSRQRASRIPLTYYRRADRFTRGKWSLAVLLAGAAGAWAWWGLARDARQHSPGALSQAHAMWDTRCEACHVPFEPIHADAVAWLGGINRQTRCEHCHQGPAHHHALKVEHSTGCTTCHHEHTGRGASLARVDSRQCTVCHENLTAHSTRPESIVKTGDLAWERVERFAKGSHPEFRSLARQDPGKLKFSHRRHLQPGQKFAVETRLAPKRLADLAAADRAVYQLPGQTDQEAVQLSCSSCHQTAGTPAGTPLRATLTSHSGDAPDQPLRIAGAETHFEPVRFDNHCRACHPLSIYPDGDTQGAPTTVAHGLPPAELAAALQGAVLVAFTDEHPDYAATERLPMPGRRAAPASSTLHDWTRNQLARAERVVHDKCNQCHELNGSPTTAALTPTQVPVHWLQAAKFSHSAHQALECRACHIAAYDYETWQPRAGESALDHERVMLPALATCVTCHAPRTADGSGGARHDCVECHRYHGADLPAATVGRSLFQLPREKRLDTHGFLQGSAAAGK